MAIALALRDSSTSAAVWSVSRRSWVQVIDERNEVIDERNEVIYQRNERNGMGKMANQRGEEGGG